jgi:hypothetical protein
MTLPPRLNRQHQTTYPSSNYQDGDAYRWKSMYAIDN